MVTALSPSSHLHTPIWVGAHRYSNAHSFLHKIIHITPPNDHRLQTLIVAQTDRSPFAPPHVVPLLRSRALRPALAHFHAYECQSKRRRSRLLLLCLDMRVHVSLTQRVGLVRRCLAPLHSLFTMGKITMPSDASHVRSIALYRPMDGSVLLISEAEE